MMPYELELERECNFYQNGGCSTLSCHRKDGEGKYIRPVEWVGCANYQALQELRELRRRVAGE